MASRRFPSLEAADRWSIQIAGGDEAGLEAVLDGPVGQGDGDVGLPAAWFAVQDQVAALRDKFGAQVGALVIRPSKRPISLGC